MTAKDNEEKMLRSAALQTPESIRLARLRAERQAEATLREQANLLNLTHDSIFVRDMDGIIKYWNRAAEELFGWAGEDTVGKVAHDLLKTVFPVPREHIEAEVVRTGRWEGELIHTKRDGTEVVVASRWSLRRSEDGAPAAILETNNDITDRRRAEEALRESEALWRAAFEGNPTMYFLVDDGGTVVSVNPFGAEQLGYGVHELVGQPVLNVFYGPDRDRVQQQTGECFQQLGRTMRWEARKVRKDGTMLWVRETASAVVLKDRPILLVVCEDITERKRTEGLLAGEKRILEMVTKGNSLPQILDGLCRLAEEQADGVLASILLLDGDRLRHGGAPSLPKAYTDAIDGAAIGPSAGSCGTAAYRGEQVIVEDIATDPLWAEYRDLALPHSLRACWSTPIFSSQGKVIATFAMYYREPRRPSLRDQEVIDQITDLAGAAIQRKLIEEKLRKSETYLAEAQRLTHTGSWAYDPTTWKPRYWSDEMYRIWGFASELDIAPDLNARAARTHQEDRDRVQERIDQAFGEGIDYAEDYRIVLPDGTVKHLHAIGHPVFDEAGQIVEYVGTTVDVTDRKRAEEERERLRQLESDLAHINRVTEMGELTASLAHELNQPIAAAVTNARTCLRWLTRDEPDLEEVCEAAKRIVNDGTRAADIIVRTRSFYAKKPPQREAVDINEVAGEMLELLRNEADRHGISMRADLAADLPTVTADRVQMQQVFMNLMLNGIEAMKGLPGELVITSAPDEDGQVVISVRDGGVGLPPEKAEQIYDAFFTTKPQGTGMGLTITRSIVERHGGRLWATANPGQGATFYFTLPGAARDGPSTSGTAPE